MKLARQGIGFVTALVLAAAGCGGEGGTSSVEGNALDSENGLSTINGLSTSNGLSTINGLSTSNGLSTINGLSSSSGLMTTASGRTTVAYLVRCALPANATLTKKDQYGNEYTFAGEAGLAPQWEDGVCDVTCQEWLSACMLSHVNTAGIHIPLWMVASSPAIGWGTSPLYPNQEAAFFGNIFISPPAAFYCNGRDVNKDPLPGRLGSKQTDPPYTDPFPGPGACANWCLGSPYPNAGDGYLACGLWTHPITVWRPTSL